MRIVGGRLRGRNLARPKSAAIRPTADRLRENRLKLLNEIREATRAVADFSRIEG